MQFFSLFSAWEKRNGFEVGSIFSTVVVNIEL
jgi:hypothetical protein